MATKAELEAQLKIVRDLNKSYLEDIDKLRQDIEGLKDSKGFISLEEYNLLKKELGREKAKSRAREEEACRWKSRYEELKKESKIKNSRCAGRKMFMDKDVIELIYSLYIEGNSLQAIANILNSKEIKNETKKEWSKGTVHFILTNKKNVDMDLIDNDTFSKVINYLTQNRKMKKENN